MFKRNLGIFLLPTVVVVACTNQKEQAVKSLVTTPTAQNQSAVETAVKEPNFENELNAGVQLSQAGQHAKALEFFQKALKRSPESPIAYNNICSSYNGLKQWHLAIDACKEALKRAPEFALAKNNLAAAEEKATAALAEIEKMKKDLSGAPAAKKRTGQIDLGFEYYKIGDYQHAIDIWKQIKLTGDSVDVVALNDLGSAYILMRKFDLARETLVKAREKDPRSDLVKRNIDWLDAAQKSL